MNADKNRSYHRGEYPMRYFTALAVVLAVLIIGAVIVILDSALEAAAPDVTQATTAQPATIPTRLALGATGDEVRYLQATLRNYGYSVAVDGVFGPQTDRAVRNFQRVSGLLADGVVGPITAAAMATNQAVRVDPPTLQGIGPDVARQALLQAGATPDEVTFGLEVCHHESLCQLDVVNRNSKTGDDSWGPWQINYYGSLRARESSIGPRESNTESWVGAASNFLKLLRSSGKCHWIAPRYCS